MCEEINQIEELEAERMINELCRMLKVPINKFSSKHAEVTQNPTTHESVVAAMLGCKIDEPLLEKATMTREKLIQCLDLQDEMAERREKQKEFEDDKDMLSWLLVTKAKTSDEFYIKTGLEI